MIEIIKKIRDRISMSVFGAEFKLRIDSDCTYIEDRLFIQVTYFAPCTNR